MSDNLPVHYSASDVLSLNKLWAECLLIKADPHKVLAKAFSDEVIREYGHLPIAKLALEVILAAQGPKVNVHAHVTNQHQPISESERWLEGIVTGRSTGTHEVLGEE